MLPRYLIGEMKFQLPPEDEEKETDTEKDVGRNYYQLRTAAWSGLPSSTLVEEFNTHMMRFNQVNQ